MTEEKRRPGRPSNAELAARAAQAQTTAAEIEAAVEKVWNEPKGVDEFSRRQSIAYARRMWDGQSPDLPRVVRLERIRVALEAQGLSMEGIEL